jgi:hypothetical protein
MKPIKDANQKSKLAEEQGKAYTSALDYMQNDDVNTQTEVDDYIITLACEEAEGMYFPTSEGDLKWQRPNADQNLHVEISVQDKVDKRFLPALDITVQILDADKNEVGSDEQLPFLWHPFLFHYGKDWVVPGDGDYTARVFIAQPTFGRHDSLIGKRYMRAVTVELGPLTVKTGQKPIGPE